MTLTSMDEPLSIVRPKKLSFAVGLLWAGLVISYIGFWILMFRPDNVAKFTGGEDGSFPTSHIYLSIVPLIGIQVTDIALSIFAILNVRRGKLWARNLVLLLFAVDTAVRLSSFTLYPDLELGKDYIYSHVVWASLAAAVLLIMTPSVTAWFHRVAARRAEIDRQTSAFEKEMDGEIAP